MKKLKLFQCPDISRTHHEMSLLVIKKNDLIAEQIALGKKLSENNAQKFELVDNYLDQVNRALRKLDLKIVYEFYEEKIVTQGPDDIKYHAYFKFFDDDEIRKSQKVNIYFVPEVRLEQLEAFLVRVKPLIQRKEFKVFLEKGILEHRKTKGVSKI